ncbi:hypothetical protein ACFX2I_045894 [Malus domestica]
MGVGIQTMWSILLLLSCIFSAASASVASSSPTPTTASSALTSSGALTLAATLTIRSPPCSSAQAPTMPSPSKSRPARCFPASAWTPPTIENLYAILTVSFFLFIPLFHGGTATTTAAAGTIDGSEEWGYVEARPKGHMFWWLYRSPNRVEDPSEPWLTILWLQGGPGDSGVGIGNFEEVGPLDTNLNPRNSIWLQKTNLLFEPMNVYRAAIITSPQGWIDVSGHLLIHGWIDMLLLPFMVFGSSSVSPIEDGSAKFNVISGKKILRCGVGTTLGPQKVQIGASDKVVTAKDA